MRKVIAVTVFLLSTYVWTLAQQGPPSGGQAASPRPQTSGANQSQSSVPGSGDQDSPQTRAERDDPSQAANQPITEGCLGGANPNFTITDKAGTTYKLNFAPDANLSSLESHIGESVQVMGSVKSSSIHVNRIGKGMGTCPASGAPKKK